MNFRLSTKLIGLFLLIGLLPFLLIGAYAYVSSSEALQQNAYNLLSIIRESKKSAITRYFNTIHDQLVTFSCDFMVLDAMDEFTATFNTLENQLGKTYDEKQASHEEQLKSRYIQQQAKTSDAPENAVELWWPREKVTRILQHLYISSNPHPLGEKRKLSSAPDGSHYSTIHAKYHPVFQEYLERFGLYDIFLIEPKNGNVVYSVQKELDFGTSLIHGPYNNTNLAKLFNTTINSSVKDTLYMADFEAYPPSFNEPAAFMATAIYRENEKIGVLVFQLPIERIDSIMTNDKQWEQIGLGQTGESYLIGPDHKFRSNSRELIEHPEEFLNKMKERKIPPDVINRIKAHNTVIGIMEFKNTDIEESLDGKEHVDEDTNYYGQPVLIAHTFITLPGGIRWALLASLGKEEAFDSLYHLRLVLWILGAIGVIGVSFVGWTFARSISLPLNEIISVVSTSSAQIAASINEQERIAAQQSASVTETNTTMEELGTSARQSAEQAEAAASSSQKAMEAAQHGMSRIEDMLLGMTTTKSKVDAIAQQILRLSEQTSQIRDITDLVSDFANETKMLAMNAAVEAVRAGEHGKGFAVISVETRKLADESKRSAERINTLVAEIQRATNATVMVTEEGSKTVESGMEIAQNTAEAFREVADSVNNASENSQQISLNVRQQAVAVKQVVEAMKSLSTGAKETSTGISQVKTGIQTLNEAAQRLRAMV